MNSRSGALRNPITSQPIDPAWLSPKERDSENRFLQISLHALERAYERFGCADAQASSQFIVDQWRERRWRLTKHDTQGQVDLWNCPDCTLVLRPQGMILRAITLYEPDWERDLREADAQLTEQERNILMRNAITLDEQVYAHVMRAWPTARNRNSVFQLAYREMNKGKPIAFDQRSQQTLLLSDIAVVVTRKIRGAVSILAVEPAEDRDRVARRFGFSLDAPTRDTPEPIAARPLPFTPVAPPVAQPMPSVTAVQPAATTPLESEPLAMPTMHSKYKTRSHSTVPLQLDWDAVLAEYDSGVSGASLMRRYNIGQTTFYTHLRKRNALKSAVRATLKEPFHATLGVDGQGQSQTVAPTTPMPVTMSVADLAGAITAVAEAAVSVTGAAEPVTASMPATGTVTLAEFLAAAVAPAVWTHGTRAVMLTTGSAEHKRSVIVGDVPAFLKNKWMTTEMCALAMQLLTDLDANTLTGSVFE